MAALTGEPLRDRFGGQWPALRALPDLFGLGLAEVGAFTEGPPGEEGIRIAEAADDLSTVSWRIWVWAVLCLRQGDLHQAISVLERGLGVCEDPPDPALCHSVCRGIGVRLCAVWACARALPLLEQALEEVDCYGFREQALRVDWLSEAYLLAGRREEARPSPRVPWPSPHPAGTGARGIRPAAPWGHPAQHEPPEVAQAEPTTRKPSPWRRN